MKTKLKKIGLLLLVCFLFFGKTINAQITKLPECNNGVPHFNIDLSAKPDSMYITPEVTRAEQCCGNPNGNQNYVSFYVKAHPQVAMIEVDIFTGANPPGDAAKYNVVTGGDSIVPGTCGGLIDAGFPTCVTLDPSGYLKVTYYKPGKNKNTYYFKQIPKPIFPADDTTRSGCSLPLNIYGLNSIVITSINSSTGNTTPGAYNSLLSCTNCDEPIFSPGLSTPAWIDYQISGTPQASSCGAYTSVDTVRLYTFGELTLSVNPNPASFCVGGSGVTLTATANGGDGNFSYQWKNSIGTVVSSSNTYLATAAGTYTAFVTDGLTTPYCPGEYVSVSVTVGNPPVVDAGIDQTVCATNPSVLLSGSVQYATGGQWSGGAGSYNPSADSLLTTYTPTAVEISSGSITLTLTSVGAGGGCVNANAQVVIGFSDTIFVNPVAPPIVCYGDVTTIQANATGGTPPLNYQWSNNSTSSSISTSAGTYSVMVRDIYGCASASTITISNPAPLALVMSSTSISADPLCDGSASVSIIGGNPPYSILWSNSETTLTTSNTLCYGIASVNVTDANGCTVSGSVVVNKPTCSAFDVTTTSTDVDCYGGSNGTAASFPAGGIPPYLYVWNSIPAQTTQNATNLSAGNYTVTVTDSVDCIHVASTTIFQPTIMTNTIVHTDVTTIGGSDGSATANPLGGTPNYQYLWTPGGQTTQSATNLNSAVGGLVYYLTITDDNSCTLNDSVLINQPPCNNFILAVNTRDISCNGLNNGSAYIVIAHGTPPYNIVWSHGPTNVTSVSGLAQGIYTVTVTDASNCTTFKTFTITEPNPLSLALVPTNISCFGAGDGTIDLTVSGGTFPFSYTWVTGSTTIANHEDIVGLLPGTYSVTVMDENKCLASGSVGITQPNKLNATYTYVDNSCNGSNDGSIDITPTGGVLPYYYSWTGPSGFVSFSQDISGLMPGLYELIISDGSACQSSLIQIFIGNPSVVSIENIKVPCPSPGASSVIVNVDSIIGGTGGPYQVSFDNQVTFQPIGIYTFSLNVGASYQIWAKDTNGCTSLSPYVLTIDTNVTVASVSFNPCISLGATTIPVTVNPIGGDGGPYQVSTDGGLTWNASGTYVINLPVNNNYSISIKDAKGCISTNYPITIPAEITSSIVMTNEVSCLGANDGTLNLTVNGGSPTYLYAWTGSSSFTSSNEDLSNLYAGTYYITITDNEGCIKLDSIDITTVLDTTKPVISCVANQTVNTTSLTCDYIVSGTAWDAVATDNCVITSVSYVLSGATSGTGTSLNNVAFNSGITFITWTAIDSLGNTETCTYTITVIDNINPTIVACGAGNQTVNVDAGQCSFTQTANVWDATATDNCTVASITATLTGVTTATGLTTLNGVSFNTGVTNVVWTVTDTVGNTETCTYTITVIDNEFPIVYNCPSDITVSNDISMCGAVVNWIPPTYTDNCVASMTSSHNPGDYFVVGTTTVTYTVTDSVNNVSTCTFDVTVNDTELPAISCSPLIASCDSLVNYNAPTATDNCGVLSITQIAGLPSGSTFPIGTTTNTFEVVDIHNNVAQCSFDVVIHPTPIITSVSTDVSCNGFNDGSIDITVTNGTTPFVYVWSNSAITEDVMNLAPGIYSVTVTDSNSCMSTAQDTIVEPTLLTIFANNTHVSCYGGSNGAIDITVSGGVLPYTYSWNNSAISEDITNLSVGYYEVTVTDVNGCAIGYSTTITSPDSIAIQTTVNNATCSAANGSIQTQVVGGVMPYTFAWSNSATTMNLYNVVTGSYTLVVTDANGCSSEVTDSIGSVSNLVASLATTDISCYNKEDGEIRVVISSGNPPYLYDWSTGGVTSVVSGLGIGTFSVLLTDSFGCQVNLITTIYQPDPLVVELDATEYPSGTNISVYGGNDGYINSIVYGGTPSYVYLWSNGENTIDISDLIAGEYSLIVTDENGCTGYARITLVQPNILEMPSGYSPNGDGSNDYFVIKGVESYPDNEIVVFNRWGNIVFEAKGYKNEWNGENTKGEVLPEGTYFVIFTAFSDKDITLKGYVDLRR
ncbi:MAG: gliding motility-associated C-terminal domain-containing protein [Vicingaceae bacterium]|nr:gliding motility-associated C-terminal domain-containing protein [Vicingaceae bacterium]